MISAARHQHGDDQDIEEQLAAAKAEPGKGIGGERAGEEGADDVEEDDHRRVQEVAPKRLRRIDQREAEIVPVPVLWETTPGGA